MVAEAQRLEDAARLSLGMFDGVADAPTVPLSWRSL